MQHLISSKSIAAVAVVLGAFVAASAAQARSDVSFSIGVQVPGVYVHAAPIYVQPRPVFMPGPHQDWRFDNGRRHDGQQWQRRSPYGDRDRDGFANIHGSGNPRNQWHQARVYGPYGDLDRDGVVNRHDRDRDGDGIRNRYDRLPDVPNRR